MGQPRPQSVRGDARRSIGWSARSARSCASSGCSGACRSSSWPSGPTSRRPPSTRSRKSGMVPTITTLLKLAGAFEPAGRLLRRRGDRRRGARPSPSRPTGAERLSTARRHRPAPGSPGPTAASSSPGAVATVEPGAVERRRRHGAPGRGARASCSTGRCGSRSTGRRYRGRQGDSVSLPDRPPPPLEEPRRRAGPGGVDGAEAAVGGRRRAKERRTELACSTNRIPRTPTSRSCRGVSGTGIGAPRRGVRPTRRRSWTGRS